MVLYLLVGFVVLFPPLQNESELFGRTIRVNLAKPMRIKEGSSRPGELGPGEGENIPGDARSSIHKLRCGPSGQFLSSDPSLCGHSLVR